MKCQASSARGASQQMRGFAVWPASSISAAKISRRVCSWSPWAFCGARWHGDREYPSEGHHARAEAFISVPCQWSPTRTRKSTTPKDTRDEAKKADRLAISEHAGEIRRSWLGLWAQYTRLDSACKRKRIKAKTDSDFSRPSLTFSLPPCFLLYPFP